MDIPYEEELTIKKGHLDEALGEYARYLGILHPAPHPEAYRNKMELAFGDEGKDVCLALGMRKKRSMYEVATPTNCILICQDFKKLITHVLKFFRATDEKFFHRKLHTGTLRHLTLRRGEFTGEILLMLSTTSTLQTSLTPLVTSLLALPLEGKIVGILHAKNDGVADAVKNENITLLHGRDYYNEKICGLSFKVSMFSFFQTNSRGAEVLYDVVRKFAGALPKSAASEARALSRPHELFEKSSAKTDIGLDLYCGTGTIAQIVSPSFKKVIGVEIIEDAILAARENAELNNIQNCEFHACDVAEILNSTEGADVIIVDPPRNGLHPKALEKLAALPAERLIYVACKPKSFARDLPTLLAAGYTLQKIEAVDMFPRTPHVEAVALLRRVDT